MCGIAGILDASRDFSPAAVLAAGHRMAASLRHRGPDSGGVLVDPALGVMLAHRRLAIVDLTAAGAQPMLSRSGRTAIVFNGEIYNFHALRRELSGRLGIGAWRSETDTELLLEAIEGLGLDATLSHLAGMFAFAVLDRSAGRLTLVRDRFGEKPLYIRAEPERLMFASDPDPLVTEGGRPPVDPTALHNLLNYGVIRQPRSIFKGIEQLPAGCLLTVEVRDGALQRGVVRSYWRPEKSARAGVFERGLISHAEAAESVEQALATAVGEQMLTDVPVGAFLSGGIDSSLIAALMQRQSSAAVRTFTVGFPDHDFDESKQAEAVARHLGTQHTTFTMTEEAMLGMIGEMTNAYAEPFADSSQIPTYCVARLARGEVTTVLTGDGGDEAFGGYNRHVFAASLWPRLERLPVGLRQSIGKAMGRAAGPATAEWVDAIGRLLPGVAQTRHARDKLGKIGIAMAAPTIAAFHDSVLRLGPCSGRFLRRNLVGVAGRNVPFERVAGHSGPDLTDDGGQFTALDQLMLLDGALYLPNDILVKVDRATMAVALESRAPFLDHRVFAAAWRLSPEQKICGGRGKVVLREILSRHLPRSLFERPKSGFALPLARWLRGGLADFAAYHLEPSRLTQSGLIEVSDVTRTWGAHLNSTVDAASELWPVIMFQAWLERRPAANLPGEIVMRQSIAAVRLGAPPANLELTT